MYHKYVFLPPRNLRMYIECSNTVLKTSHLAIFYYNFISISLYMNVIHVMIILYTRFIRIHEIYKNSGIYVHNISPNSITDFFLYKTLFLNWMMSYFYRLLFVCLFVFIRDVFYLVNPFLSMEHCALIFISSCIYGIHICNWNLTV